MAFFGSKVLGNKDPQNQMRTFYAPMGTHQVRKFGAIAPTDPNDTSQDTPDFWRCTAVIAVCNAVFRSTVSCCNPEIFAIKSRSP